MKTRRPRQVRLVVASLSVGALAAWLWHPGPPEPAPSVAAGAVVARAATATAITVESSPSPATPPATTPVPPMAAPAPCVGQPVLLTEGVRTDRQCFGPSTALQSGSVVSYRFEGRAGPAMRWLVAEVAGREIVAVSTGQGGLPDHACEGKACVGLSVGEADLYGVKTLRLAHLQLSPAGGTSATDSLSLDGTLLTTADGATADAPACAGQTVLISASHGRGTRFCPSDGIGVSRDDDGGWTYRFADAEGTALVVALDDAMRLRRVEHGRLSCVPPACAGVEIGGGESPGPRTIGFGGTLIQAEPGAVGWETLAGRLVLPSW